MLDSPGIMLITFPSGPSLSRFWNCSYMSRKVKSLLPSASFLYSSGWSSSFSSCGSPVSRHGTAAQRLQRRVSSCTCLGRVVSAAAPASCAAAGGADLEHGEQSADISHAEQPRHEALSIERFKIVDVLSCSDENDG